MRPTKNIALAIIRHDGKYLLQRRLLTADHLPGLWEFPGGKMDENESPQEAAERECLEELGVDVRAGRMLGVILFDYPEFTVKLHVVWCAVAEDAMTDIEATAAESLEWMPLAEARTRQIPPANQTVLELLATIE